MNYLSPESSPRAGADLVSRQVLGIDGYVRRMSPRSEAAREALDALLSAPFLSPSSWREEIARLKALDEQLDESRRSALGADLAELPTLERPWRRLDAGEVLRDADFFEVKRFLFFACRVLDEAAGLDDLPRAQSKTGELLRTTMKAIHPENASSSRFHLADELDKDLKERREELREVRRQLQERRKWLEEQVLAQNEGRFDVHGHFRPSPGQALDESFLSFRGEHFELDDEELERLEKSAHSRSDEVAALEDEQRRRLTRTIAGVRTQIEPLRQMLVDFDLRLARVGLRRAVDGCWPQMLEEGEERFCVDQGRDPALVAVLGDKVQPIDLVLDAAATMVLGPNMGGKSALLRLVGLFQWSAQMALPLPAIEVFFRPVDAVVYVGSEEPGTVRVEEGLSSFGREVRRLVEHWDGEGPVFWLLDEPARGTHPDEGARLAEQIVEARKKKGDALLVATHFPGLADLEGCARRRIRGLTVDDEALRQALKRAEQTGHTLQDTLRRFMDYQVDVVDKGTVPRDATRIARALGLKLP